MPSALASRGAFVGALGGVAAGAVDFALAVGRAGAFLPAATWKLGLFLGALYGAAGGLAGLAVGLSAAALGWATDLGPLWGAAFGDGREEKGARWVAYGAATAAALVGLGAAARAFTVQALHVYHHRLLIAGLVGAATAGLAVAAAAAVFVVAAALSPLVRFGPRPTLRLRAPAGAMAAAWALGLIAAAGAVAALVLALEQRARMAPAVKALNTGLWAPALVASTLGMAHLVGRLAGGRLRGAGWRRPGGAALAVAIALGVPFAVAAAIEWPTVRQLDGRPWIAALVAVAVALGLAVVGVGRGLGARARGVRSVLAVGAPALLLATALSAGRNDRVRKSAASFTGLTAPLVAALHAATDFDGDGYSSVLGGGDCDDFDRTVHPGAFDWPDDGIDQDCNGHQATLAAPPPRRWAALPPTVPADLNVILLSIDALRADHVGSYGYARPTTPNLDALARESVRFEEGWAHAPSTRYSVPAILTGRYPSTIAVGSAHWPPDVLPSNRLWAEILKERGYATGAMLSYHYFERAWGLDQGFDEYDYHLQTLHSMGGDPAATRGSSARELAELDIAFIQRHAGEKFFLWSHFYDTHFMFERHAEPETHFGNSEIDLYDGEIRFTDMQLGRVFDALKQAGLWDKTILIITADHGDGFGEHGIPVNQRHGYHLYRTETKVPLIVRVPGVAPRVVGDAPVGHIDLLPTVLNALGQPADAEPQLLGQSALGLMLGEERPDAAVFQEVWYEGPVVRKAVVADGWHLIRNVTPDDTSELYDLRADPAEEHDRAGENSDAERRLRDKLGAWMDQAALPADFRRRIEGNVAAAPLPFTTPLGDAVGDALVIDGVDVATPTVRAPGRLELSLLLRGAGTVAEGWRLFTHVIGPGGRMINADHEPLEGVYPIERLRKGTWLRDRIVVQLPAGWPPGPVTVDVGLWRRNQRAAVRGTHAFGDAVRVATIQVVP